MPAGTSVTPGAGIDVLRRAIRVFLTEPFQARTWYELGFFLVSGLVAALGALLVAAAFLTGSFLSVVFVGVVILAGGLRGARGIGAWQRSLARHFLGETIADPEPFGARPGLFGWLGSAMRDRAAWRALVYVVAKVPIVIFGSLVALRVWLQAFTSVLHGFSGTGSPLVRVGGVARDVVLPGFAEGGPGALTDRLTLFLSGLVLLLIAPWVMRVFVYTDRMLMRVLLGPDAIASRVQTLERSRAQTVETAAATLRRIERNLHDGTQAQLVALAMRLGQAKDKLAEDDQPDLEAIRRLVDEAHQGAKDAIVELRDLARGIHPPVLDTGLEGALVTLTARSAVPTHLQVSMQTRPSPAIEAISYFCVAELLSNVAQHAHAAHVSISCAEHGPWLRIVVRDDGHGGATVNRLGATSSGLAGLTDRVASVDGHLSIASPAGGPTVVTVDLPLRA